MKSKEILPSRDPKYLRTLTLNDIIRQAIIHDYINTILIWGDKGLGKSSLALRKMRYAWGNWKDAFNHTVFTLDEFISIYSQYQETIDDLYRNGDLDAISRRARGILWDDVSAYFHATTLNYLDKNVMMTINKLVLARQYVSNIIFTTDHLDKIPNVLFQEVNIMIYVFDRGIAEVFYLRKLPKFKGPAGKTYKKLYTLFRITWSDLPNDIKKTYLQMRHRHAMVLEEIAKIRDVETDIEDEIERRDIKSFDVDSIDSIIDAVDRILP